jgi:hypothetical protein
MANDPNPNTPYDPDRLNNPTRTNIVGNDRRPPADLDNDLQADPELAEGPASNSRVAIFAVGIAVVVGVVFYGLNHSSLHQQASTPPAPASSQNTANSSPPAAPPGMRDVTPHANSQPGTTTGAAPANPQKPSPAPPNPGGANTNNATPGNAPAKQ